VADDSVDIRALFDRSVANFTRLVESTRDEQWDNSTPCTEWSVRDLVNHLTSEALWAPPLLAGTTIDDVGADAFDGDLLGDDPKGAWRQAAKGEVVAVERPDSLEITTHLSFGDFPGEFYISQLMSDHLVHGWDLARGIDADDEMDEEVARYIYDFTKPFAHVLPQSSGFADPIDVPEDSDLQTKLLAMMGRRR
jgi:uncharacterized protein (TIGR03086 family)